MQGHQLVPILNNRFGGVGRRLSKLRRQEQYDDIFVRACNCSLFLHARKSYRRKVLVVHDSDARRADSSAEDMRSD